MTPLMFASKKGRIEVMRYLVQHGANVNERGGQRKYPVLIYAVLSRKLDAVKLLVENGAEVEGKSEFHETPLMIAVVNNNLEIVKYLVEKGADVNAKTYPFQQSVLKFNTGPGGKKVREYLRSKGAVK